MKCKCGNEMELQHVCESCGERVSDSGKRDNVIKGHLKDLEGLRDGWKKEETKLDTTLRRHNDTNNYEIGKRGRWLRQVRKQIETLIKRWEGS